MLRNRPQGLLPRAVSHPEEARHAAAFRFERVHRQSLEIPATGMGHVIFTAAQAAFIPGVHDIKHQRPIHTNGRVHALGWLPSPVPDAGDRFTHHPCWLKRQRHLIAGDLVTIRGSAAYLHLQTLQGRIHVAGGAADRTVLPGHMPGLQSGTQLKGYALDLVIADPGEPELEMGREPLALERVTLGLHIVDDVLEVLPDIVR